MRFWQDGNGLLNVPKLGQKLKPMNAIHETAAVLQSALRIVVLTGAGVSKESGVPTFRDALEGLWEQYDPSELATPEAFERNPSMVWEWYEHRREMCRDAQPNPGHFALAALEKHFGNMLIVTQNVDDLHERAGSKNIIHLHGNLAESKCFDNCQGSPTIVDVTNLPDYPTAKPPACPHCGQWVRPNVVWFGEMLPQQELYTAMDASREADVMLVVGTSGLVHPAAGLPTITRQADGQIIEINPIQSAITPIANIKIDAAFGVALPQILEVLGIS